MGYIELNEETIEKINLLNFNYDLKGNLLPINSVNDLVDDLFTELEVKEEKIADLVEYKSQVCKQIENYPYGHYGVSESDFH